MRFLLKYAFLILFLSFSFLFSCKKDRILTDKSAQLGFSADTVIFDTVFTSVGSATKRLKVYNPYKEKLIISSIALKNGGASPFRLNVDGVPGPVATELEIAGKDSLYIFIEVTINPNSILSPFIVTDAILFAVNGNQQEVQLVAWGQNAHYIYPDRFVTGLPAFSIIGCDTTWTDNTPHIIYGFAVVDSLCRLTIKEGTKIYLHEGAGLWIYKGGTLKVQGTKDRPVLFQGDRLEAGFAELPGQWDRIWINEGSVDNEIDYAIIKNGFIGIQAETLSGFMGNKLKLSNSIIKNMTGIGIYTRFYYVQAYNNIVANCAQYTLAATLGGELDFKHCTFANYYTYKVRQNPSVLLNNFNNVQSIPLTINFGNCILYGDLANELKFDSKSDAAFNVTFANCLLKVDNSINTANAAIFTSPFVNQDPGFKSTTDNDYSLLSGSFCIDKGDPAIAAPFPVDIRNNSRLPLPDLGAMEYLP